VPRLAAGAGSLRQRLAMTISALKAAEVRTLAQSNAGHEKRHVGLLRVRACADRQQ
jgi:hypothetical protein